VEKKTEESSAIAVEEEMFAFACTSDFNDVAQSLQIPKSKRGAVVDSGASSHFCPDRAKFATFRAIEERPIKTADGRTLKAIGMGDVHIDLPNGSRRTKAVLKDAVYAPDMAFTLVSVGRLDDADCAILFKNRMCTIKDPSGRTMATLPRSEGLYCLIGASSEVSSENAGVEYANVASVKLTISEAHRRFGHITHAAIRYAVNQGKILGVEIDPMSKPEFCEVCAKAKSAKQPFPKESETRAENYGERVHWDLWGPATVKSINGHHYAAARIDDATCETKLYFQSKKSETINSYKRDEAYVETQSGNHIKFSRSDRGGEFLSKELIQHQDNKGTQRELTVHDSPPQNGSSERGMRTRAERARALLLGSGLPQFLWEEAMKHVAWLQNRTPSRAINGKTPYEMRHGKKPYMAGIQEFGAAAYVKDLDAGKLDA
jgi:hypothetical protein